MECVDWQVGMNPVRRGATQTSERCFFGTWEQRFSVSLRISQGDADLSATDSIALTTSDRDDRALKQTRFASLESVGKKRQTRREKFLGEMERVVPWQRLTALIQPQCPTNHNVGRPPEGVSRMLRMYLLQQLYSLFDEGLERAIYDSQPPRRRVPGRLPAKLEPKLTPGSVNALR